MMSLNTVQVEVWVDQIKHYQQQNNLQNADVHMCIK